MVLGTAAIATTVATGGAAAPAIAGLFVPAGTVGGTAVGAVAAGAAATGAAATGAAATGAAGVAPLIAACATNPIGWAVLGAEENPSIGDYTFDCWKPVLHVHSTTPSKGMLLRDIAADPRIKQVQIAAGTAAGLPEMILYNIWDEKYRIDFVYIYSDQLAAHAVKIE